MVGIRFEPAIDRNNMDGFFILVGCNDGSFSELYVDSTGGITRTCFHTIPARCPISTIYQINEEYLLEDDAGRLWSCDSGVKLINKTGYIDKIRDKFHSAVPDSMGDLVSSWVWDELGLQTYPGGDGRMWE